VLKNKGVLDGRAEFRIVEGVRLLLKGLFPDALFDLSDELGFLLPNVMEVCT
jgi:hypothetical protein